MAGNEDNSDINLSLDDYILKNSDKFKRTKSKIGHPKYPSHQSQQWRLGRNGPVPLKRLGRSGTLRPVYHHHGGGSIALRANDGLPKLVRKRLRFLDPNSVFFRLGWNPLVAIAKRRVQQAKENLWRLEFNYRPRHRILSLPLGRRPNYIHQFPLQRRPSYIHQNPLGRRQKYIHQGPWLNFQQSAMRPYNRWQQPQGGRPNWCMSYNQDKEKFNKLIAAQRLQNRRYKQLRQIQSNQANRGLRRPQSQQTRLFNQQYDQPRPLMEQPGLFIQGNVADASASVEHQYPIARDEYVPPVNRDVRPPSPDGSIISAVARSVTNSNPFARPVSQSSAHQITARNPFAPQTSGIPNRLNSAFRPTPQATNVTFNQRFGYPMMVERPVEHSF